MASGDAQKSEVHDEAADASSSPTAKGDSKRTRSDTAPGQLKTAAPRDIPASNAQTIIISDQSDDGGPIVIQSQDAALNPPQVPQDPFPTGGVADVDVVSDSARPAKRRPTSP